MKSKLFILILFFSLIVTGCGSETKTLKCTATSNNDIGTTNSDLEIKVRSGEVKDMTLTVEVELTEDNQEYKEAMAYQMLQKTSQVYTTEKGLRAIFDMDNSYFQTLNISKDASYSELKQVLELQGYTCEE